MVLYVRIARMTKMTAVTSKSFPLMNANARVDLTLVHNSSCRNLCGRLFNYFHFPRKFFNQIESLSRSEFFFFFSGISLIGFDELYLWYTIIFVCFQVHPCFSIIGCVLLSMGKSIILFNVIVKITIDQGFSVKTWDFV